MTPAPDGITVVMPTRGRVEIVAEVLAGLRRAIEELPVGVGAELFVVDDTPGRDGERLAALCDAERGEHYVRGPRRVAAKRNLGARKGKYPYLLFIDSDCIPSRSFLVDHYRELQKRHTERGVPVGAVAGPTFLLGEADNWSWRVAEFSEIYNAPNEWPGKYREVFWAATANLSMRSTVFEEVGGFHEEPFTVVGGEDVDISMRIREAGYTIVCAPSAVVRHARTPRTFPEMAQKLVLYGRSSVYNAVRQPHQQALHANRITLGMICLAIPRIAGQRRLARHAWGILGLVWMADATRLLRRRAVWAPGLAFAAVALEWSFDLGIALEAARRRRLDCMLKRFRYFESRYFVPLDGDDRLPGGRRPEQL